MYPSPHPLPCLARKGAYSTVNQHIPPPCFSRGPSVKGECLKIKSRLTTPSSAMWRMTPLLLKGGESTDY